MRPHGRIIISGMISQENTPLAEQYGIRTLSFIHRSRIKMEGFLVTDDNMGPKYFHEWRENMSQWLIDGSIKTRVCLNYGLENACEGLCALFEGRNFGKAILKV